MRTIVVWKLLGRSLSHPVYKVLSENHSGMETLKHHVPQLHVEHGLSENHSGMETSFEVPWKLPSSSWVRTIVVWKLYCLSWHIVKIRRWVRTIVVWKRPSKSLISFSRVTLSENHSGMETRRFLILTLLICAGWVRTIVVWKQEILPAHLFRFSGWVRTIVVWKLTERDPITHRVSVEWEP